MSASVIKEPLVLAFYFNTNGIAYALFEGIMDTVDWGVTKPRTRTVEATMEQVGQILKLLKPSVVVLQNCRCSYMRSSERTKKLVAATSKLARGKKMKVVRYTRSDIRNCFAHYGATTKEEIARAIAERLPEFQSRVPPLHKLGDKEDYHMGVFDAVALVTTYYWKEFLDKGTD